MENWSHWKLHKNWGGGLWQFSEQYHFVHTTHGKKKEKGIKLAWGEFFSSSSHITEPTSCKQHKFHRFILQSSHTSVGFYFSYYFWQNWLGNMRQRGKLGMTFTTERWKKLDIIHLLTGVKSMYFQAQWSSFPPVVFSFNLHWMRCPWCICVCVFLQHTSPAVSRMKNWVYSLW